MKILARKLLRLEMRLFCPIFQHFDETRNLKLTAKKGKVISLSDTFKIQEEALTIIEHGHYRCPGLTAAVKTRGNPYLFLKVGLKKNSLMFTGCQTLLIILTGTPKSQSPLRFPS